MTHQRETPNPFEATGTFGGAKGREGRPQRDPPSSVRPTEVVGGGGRARPECIMKGGRKGSLLCGCTYFGHRQGKRTNVGVLMPLLCQIPSKSSLDQTSLNLVLTVAFSLLDTLCPVREREWDTKLLLPRGGRGRAPPHPTPRAFQRKESRLTRLHDPHSQSSVPFPTSFFKDECAIFFV